MANKPMNATGPTAGEGDQPELVRGSHHRLSDLDDDQLLAALASVLRTSESAPDWLVELAKADYDLLAVDAELAQLTSDSGLAGTQSALRSAAAPRLTVFDTQDLSVEVQIEPGARTGSWRLIGQLTPAEPARIQVRQPGGEPFWVDADDLGRFTVDQLTDGPLSLVCARTGQRPAVTEWIAIG
jgi:hypothetical protein